jgi:GNAT superfamily N-acetyltransferase
MAAEFRIRAATATDIPALRLLIERSVRELSKNDYSAAEMDGAIHHVLGLDTQLIHDQTYFVASPAADASVLAGCGGWSYRKTLCGSDDAPNRESASLDSATEAARIRAIFVHPEWARRGLGTLILKHCEEAATNAGFRHFEMGSTLTGVPLYALKGYEARERVDIALLNGAVLPVLRMTKSI